MKSYSRVARAVLTRPWAIYRDSIQWAAIVEILGHRLAGDPLSDDEIDRRLAEHPKPEAAVRVARAPTEREGRYVAVLPIHGVLMPRVDMMTEASGGASVTQLSAAFAEAVADDGVEAIVLDIDSPGGLIDGIPEFAAQIREARERKPVVAVVDTMAASAAYWLASQASELSVTPSGEVGSIGVFTAHEDASKFWDEMGIKTTLIKAGKYKAEANEFEPLSDDAREFLQSKVDEFYGMFVGDVAKGRGVKASEVRSGYGQGRMLTASMAKAEGMVDRIETLGQALERVSRPGGRRGPRRSALEEAGGALLAVDRELALAEQVDVAAAEEEAADPAVVAATERPEGPDVHRVAFEVEQAVYRARARRLRRTS